MHRVSSYQRTARITSEETSQQVNFALDSDEIRGEIVTLVVGRPSLRFSWFDLTPIRVACPLSDFRGPPSQIRVVRPLRFSRPALSQVSARTLEEVAGALLEASREKNNRQYLCEAEGAVALLVRLVSEPATLVTKTRAAGALEEICREEVQGVGCRVQGAECREQGAGCRVQGAGCRM